MEAIGQDALTRRLARHAEEGSLAHAMLLTGAPGRGGLALALNLARRLHCQNPGPEGACGAYVRPVSSTISSSTPTSISVSPWPSRLARTSP